MNRLLIGAFAALFAASLAPAFAQPAGGSNAAMPSCSSGDPVVWENTAGKKKVYHMSGDKYYGNTKHGKYVCQSQANTDGFHAAKMKGGMAGGPTTGGSPAPGSAMASPGPMASGMPMGRHHKHHKHGMGMASPAPSGAPSPAAT